MGGESRVTIMVLKVDLGCGKCCRKIKRVLCSLPQIRDQLFDEKSNTVTVSAICGTPEKVADKIRAKAGGTVKGIDIKPSQPPAKPPAEKPRDGPPPPAEKPKLSPPPRVAEIPISSPPPAAEKPRSQKPPAAEKPKSAQPPADKPKSDEKPKSAPPPADKPKSDEKPKSAPPPSDKPKSDEKPKSAPHPSEKPKSVGDGEKQPPPQAAAPPPKQQPFPLQGAAPPPQQQQPRSHEAMMPNQPAAFMTAESIPVAGHPSIFPPVVYYYGGPYYQNQGMPALVAPPQMFSPHNLQPIYQYDGYEGRPVGDYYGGARDYKSDYFSEDNPSTCSVM